MTSVGHEPVNVEIPSIADVATSFADELEGTWIAINGKERYIDVAAAEGAVVGLSFGSFGVTLRVEDVTQ